MVVSPLDLGAWTARLCSCFGPSRCASKAAATLRTRKRESSRTDSAAPSSSTTPEMRGGRIAGISRQALLSVAGGKIRSHVVLVFPLNESRRREASSAPGSTFNSPGKRKPPCVPSKSRAHFRAMPGNRAPRPCKLPDANPGGLRRHRRAAVAVGGRPAGDQIAGVAGFERSDGRMRRGQKIADRVQKHVG